MLFAQASHGNAGPQSLQHTPRPAEPARPQAPKPAARPDHDDAARTAARAQPGTVMITATYPDARRKVAMIKKTVLVCPIFGDEFSPGDEFSVYMTAKSPSGGNST
jgi:hypothetical protein